MKAIVIYDDNNNFLGLAANYSWAIDFLIKEDFLNENTRVWVNNNEFLLEEIFPNWQEEIKNWGDIEFFNKFFSWDFHLQFEEVHGVKYWE